MNKNYLRYAALMLLFTFINPSFAMGGKIFTLTRFFGVTATPCFMGTLAYDGYEKLKNFDQEESLSGSAIEQWGKEKVKKLNVPGAESIVFVKTTDWVTNGKRIGIPAADIASHELISSGVPVYDQEKIVALHSISLKHEVGHIAHNDVSNRLCQFIGIPFGVEAISFGATRGLRKLCNIQPLPKTFFKTILRSSCAIGSIWPKSFIGAALIMFLRREQEIQADHYACKNAESRLELEMMANQWRENEVKECLQRLSGKKDIQSDSLFSTHPSFGIRREMVESYLAQWDRDHAHEVGKRA